MNIYEDYFNFKEENDSLLNELVQRQSKILYRFAHVIDVVEFYYKKYVKNDEKDLDQDEEIIFETGFNYIFDHFSTIKMLLEHTFHNDIDLMNKFGKSINLLLYTIDFENDLYDQKNDAKEEIDQLLRFEDKIQNYLDENENCPDEMFGLLDDIIDKIYTKLDIDYYGVNDIFYDIAIDLDLVDEEDEGLDLDEILEKKE